MVTVELSDDWLVNPRSGSVVDWLVNPMSGSVVDWLVNPMSGSENVVS